MSGKQTKEHHQLGTDGFFFQTALPHVHSGMSAGTMPPDSCCAQMLKMLQ